MTDPLWGLLGPESLLSERRTRTLGVAVAVRAFNDLAVPGLGRIWFAKQLLLALLGVAVAERLSSQNLPAVKNSTIADAIEALACWLALSSNGWKSDPRIQGVEKLQGKKDLSFATVSRRGFYLQTTMRMATVQPLRALGLVEAHGDRFNAYRCTSLGQEFIAVACQPFTPCYRKQGVVEYLTGWVAGDYDNPAASEALTAALSPVLPLPALAREHLLECLVRAAARNDARRGAALLWVDQRRGAQAPINDWVKKPAMLDDGHWMDLRAGAKFVLARDAAIGVLDHIEHLLAHLSGPRRLDPALLPQHRLVAVAEPLKRRAQDFLDEAHDPTPGKLASQFCRECSGTDPSGIIAALVKRDERVLCLRDGYIVPGPAFRDNAFQRDGNAPEAEGETDILQNAGELTWPEGISPRIRNLFLLNADLCGELDHWLSSAAVEEMS